jgi:hypothetical protein
MTAKQKKIAYLLLALCTAALLASITTTYTTSLPIIKDARQNVHSAYYLTHGGMISTDGETPSMRREPLPIIAVAALLMIHPDFSGTYGPDDLTDGRLNPSVKKINAFWRFLAVFFVFMLCWELFSGTALAALVSLTCIAISELVFFSHPIIVDRLYTELPASALLLIASWCAVRYVRQASLLSALYLGIALGALALTKAAFLYVGIAFVALLLVMDLVKTVREADKSWRSLATFYAIIVLAFAGTLAPWLVRNHIQFGTAQIVERGELVLAVRTLLTEQPLLGGLYAYSPWMLKKHLVGPLTGYKKADLKPGGRLHDLVTAKSRRNETFKQRMEADGFEGDRKEWLNQVAFAYIAQHPLRYVASIGVFAYKGMWFMIYGRFFYFNLIAVLLFVGVFIWALLSGNRTLVAAFGLSFGSFLFISVFTHALTRYNAPITPIVIIADLWLLIAITQMALKLPLVQKIHHRLAGTLHGTSDARSLSHRQPTTVTSSSDTASRA